MLLLLTPWCTCATTLAAASECAPTLTAWPAGMCKGSNASIGPPIGDSHQGGPGARRGKVKKGKGSHGKLRNHVYSCQLGHATFSLQGMKGCGPLGPPPSAHMGCRFSSTNHSLFWSQDLALASQQQVHRKWRYRRRGLQPSA